MDNIIRLGDYITEICEKTTVNNQHMVLTSSQEGIVSQDDYFNKQVASKDNTGYKVIRRGQFTYRAMSDTGRFYINRLCDYDTGIVSPAYPVFELKKNEDILPDYLQEYFHSEQFQNSIALSSTGSTRVSLKLAKIADLRIAVPSISDQRHMIIAIQHVSDLISAQNSALCKLDELVKSRFIELFDGKGYPKIAIGELVASKVSSVKKVFAPTDTIKYIDISSIDNKRNVMTGYTEYVLEEAPSRAQQHIKMGDIVVSTVRPNLKNVAITGYEYDNLVASSGFCVLRAEKCLPAYLMAVVCSDDFTDAMTKVVTGANYPAIKDSDVRGYVVPNPPIELQEQFATFVEQADKSKLAVKQSLEKLETLKKSLMQQYFG